MKYLTVLLLSSLPLLCQADVIEDEWVYLIKKDFSEGCVDKLTPYLWANGNNGRRSVAWLVESCEGLFEYGSGYSPPNARTTDEPAISVLRLKKLPPLTREQIERMYH